MTSAPLDTVMVVDDDAAMRDAICQALQLDGFSTIAVKCAEDALASCDASFPGIVLLDLRMPGTDGLTLFSRLMEIDGDLPIIILTGHGDVVTAVDLMRRGAYDFLSKPFTSDSLLPSVRRALEKRKLVLENRRLQSATSIDSPFGLIGNSRAIQRAREAIGQLVNADLPILVLGETGTGKSLVSKQLHTGSQRSSQPIITIDCGALPGLHPESYLFGHASGAIAESPGPKMGVLRQVQKGTLILDQVDRLPAQLQSKLARVLESKAVTPIGSEIPTPLDCKIVATAHPNLPEEAQSGGFDINLFYRLAGFQIELPPLRDRAEDVPLLFKKFVTDAAEYADLPPPTLTPLMWKRLEEHNWPGNVRELKNWAEAIALGLDQSMGTAQETAAKPLNAGLRQAVNEYEASLLKQVLSQCKGDVAKALQVLKLPRKTFYDKLTRHSISAADYRSAR